MKNYEKSLITRRLIRSLKIKHLNYLMQILILMMNFIQKKIIEMSQGC